MDIENITRLQEQLELLGCEQPGPLLLKRICFKPEHFIFSRKINKGNDRLIFQYCISLDVKKSCYILKHNDVTLRKAAELPNTTISGINIMQLNERMSKIDWERAFDFEAGKAFDFADISTWTQEKQISDITEDLFKLSASNEGALLVNCLKLKYWAEWSAPEYNLLNHIRNKYEVSQRFYFSDDQQGITTDEAYRYLRNKWIEKEMQADRRSGHRKGNNGDPGKPDVPMTLVLQKKKGGRKK